MDIQSIALSATFLFIILAALIGGIIAQRLKQPLLVGYITAGVFFGNIAPQFIDREFVQLIADVGIVLLLFTLGVEFSFRRLKRIIGSTVWAAPFQIIISIGVFLMLFWVSGMEFLPSLFIAVAAALSSTAVVIKSLAEKGELDTKPGEVLTGWLIIQDLAVIPIMLLLFAIISLQSGGSTSFNEIATTVSLGMAKSIVSLALIVFFGRIVIPRLLTFVVKMKSREIFLLTTVGIVFFAALAATAVGLSAAIGAFIAGLLIADTSQNHAIFSEIRPLRNLFSVIFFVSLGLLLPFSFLWGQLPRLILFTVAVIGVKWFLVYGISRYLGFHRKTAFLVSVGLTQVSEFGFVIAREGVMRGALTNDTYVFLVALTFLTILISAPLMARGQGLYYYLRTTLGERWPKFFPHRLRPREDDGLDIKDHVVICGYGRVGKYIGRALEMSKIRFLVVDYNHSLVTKLRRQGIEVVYGDPADVDVLDYAQVDKAKVLVIAIPDFHTQEMIIANAQTLNRKIHIICRTHFEEDQKILKSLGVQSVIQPEFEAALSVIVKLLPSLGVSRNDLPGKISRLKIEHGVI